MGPLGHLLEVGKQPLPMAKNKINALLKGDICSGSFISSLADDTGIGVLVPLQLVVDRSASAIVDIYNSAASSRTPNLELETGVSIPILFKMLIGSSG